MRLQSWGFDGDSMGIEGSAHGDAGIDVDGKNVNSGSPPRRGERIAETARVIGGRRLRFVAEGVNRATTVERVRGRFSLRVSASQEFVLVFEDPAEVSEDLRGACRSIEVIFGPRRRRQQARERRARRLRVRVVHEGRPRRL